jgi:hypothetical protein
MDKQNHKHVHHRLAGASVIEHKRNLGNPLLDRVLFSLHQRLQHGPTVGVLSDLRQLRELELRDRYQLCCLPVRPKSIHLPLSLSQSQSRPSSYPLGLLVY